MTDHYEPGAPVWVNVFGGDTAAIVVRMAKHPGEVIVMCADPEVVAAIGPIVGQYETKHVRPRTTE